MRVVLSLIALLVWAALPQVIDPATQPPETSISGYAKDVRGEVARHESPHPDAISTLVAHAADPSHNAIEWDSGIVPEEARGPLVLRLVWSICVGPTPAERARWSVYANDTKLGTLENPPDSGARDWTIASDTVRGAQFEAHLFWADRHAEPVGHLYVRLPPALYTPGRAVRLKIIGEMPPGSASKSAASKPDAASRDIWLMVFRHDARPRATVRAEPALMRGENGRTRQQLRVDIAHYGEPTQASVTVDASGERTFPDFVASGVTMPVQRGYTTLRVPIRVVHAETTAPVKVTVSGDTLFDDAVPVAPVKPVTLYLMHHSHLDIGYTHVQRDVATMQARNLEQALALVEKTRGYPADARFKWNVEGFWSVEAFLARATPEQRAQLREAVRSRNVEIGPLYGNQLTGLAQPEELTRMTDEARRFAREAGVPLESAWISDVPGYTWGIVPALTHSGIRYFSLGTNTGDRIGHIIERLGDRPFYWRSASGQEKLLCWLHAKGYSSFHTGLSYARRTNLLNEERLFGYLRLVQTPDRPYDLLPLRYNIGADNGPPDDQLSDLVRTWNEHYVSPHLVISTVTEFFTAFEKRYGATLPVLAGDLTPYWEDGAYSTARESIANQASAARLEQVETLWALQALRAPQASHPFPVDRFRDAWRSVLLFNEHTWGSWNSISAPESPFTKTQWATKRAFALEAERQSSELLDESLRPADGPRDETPDAVRPATDSSQPAVATSVDVFNSLSWPRTDIVTLPASSRPAGDRVIDAQGRPVPSQRLSSGALAFLAMNVPALGARRYRFVLPPTTTTAPGVEAVAANDSRATLTGNGFSIELDPATGAIRTLTGVPIGDGGLNRYLYQAGRLPTDAQMQSSSNVRISVGERGPLVASLIAESSAPGTNMLRQEVRLIAGVPRVEIIDTIDKRNSYDPEAVYFAFPFDISDPQTRLGLVHGFYRPEAQQLPGACKNYFTVRNWLDVSNAGRGVTLVTPDALLVELGQVTTDANKVGWLEHAADASTVFSYAMNNFWGTNYKAGQDGIATFRYALLPHARFDAARAYKAGLEATHPLVLRPTALPAAPITRSAVAPLRAPFLVRGRGVIVSAMKPSDDGRGVIVRLFNAGDRAERPRLVWVDSPRPRRRTARHVPAISLVDRDDRPIRRIAILPRLPPFGLLTVYLGEQPIGRATAR